MMTTRRSKIKPVTLYSRRMMDKKQVRSKRRIAACPVLAGLVGKDEGSSKVFGRAVAKFAHGHLQGVL